jgi:hypothetical protein
MLLNNNPSLMLYSHIWAMLLIFAFLKTLTSLWFHIKKVCCIIIAFLLVKVWHLSSYCWQKFTLSWSYFLASTVSCTTSPLSFANVELNTLVKPRIGIHHIVLCGIGDYFSCFEIIKCFSIISKVVEFIRSIDCINIMFPLSIASIMLLWAKE